MGVYKTITVTVRGESEGTVYTTAFQMDVSSFTLTQSRKWLPVYGSLLREWGRVVGFEEDSSDPGISLLIKGKTLSSSSSELKLTDKDEEMPLRHVHGLPFLPKMVGSFSYQGEKLYVFQGHYAADPQSIAIFVKDRFDHPYTTVSEYHEGTSRCFKDGEFVVQSRNMSKDFLGALLGSGLFEDTGRRFTFGPFETKEPIWRLRLEERKEDGALPT